MRDYRLVRDQAFKAMQMFMARLEAAAEAMVRVRVHLGRPFRNSDHLGPRV